jgi:autotransporter-associated beta strand protein
MKPKYPLRFSTHSSLALISFTLAAGNAQAADIYWDGADTGGLNSAANWSTVSGATTPNPAAIPGALDDVFFNITTDNSNQTPTMNSAARSFRSITFNSTGTTTIVAGSADTTLTVGTGGITMAANSGAVTLGNGVAAEEVLIALAGGQQIWTNNSTNNFTVNNAGPTFSRTATGSTIVFNTTSTGNFAINTASLPNNTTGIIGNWALFGTGANQRYAFNNSGTIAAYTSGTVAADANALTDATINYDLTSAAVTLSASRTANTIRYAGTGGAIDLVGNTLTTNGILAVGTSGTLTIQRSSGVGTLTSGTSPELNISGSQNVTISAPISGSGKGVTKSGNSLLVLSGANTYTGTTFVNAGTVNMSGSFGNTPITVNNGTLNITGSVGTGAVTVNGGTLNMGGTGGNSTLTVNGGLLNYTSASAGGAAITMSGGTLLLNGPRTGGISMTGGTLQVGASATVSGQITLVGTIASDSTNARTITGRIVLNGDSTIGNAVNNGKLTFTPTTNTSTVGSGPRTLTVLSDAEFTTGFVNGGGGGITKTGPATLTISGGNSPYTGTTIVNGGMFALANNANLFGVLDLVTPANSKGTAVTVNSGGTFGIRKNANAGTNAIGQIGQTTASSLTLTSGSALNMVDGFYSTLDLVGTANLAPASGAGVVSPLLTFDLIGANSDRLAVTGAATVGTSTARIAISPTSTPTAGTSFTVITAASGLNTNFALANSLLPTANGLMSLAFTGSTGTSQIVSVADDSNALYWSGATDGDWNTAGNWNTSIAGGVASGSAPSGTTNVAFSTTTPVAANLSNSLSAALTVNSINFLPGTGSVTIGGSAITVNTDINDNSATNQTINAPLAVTGNINKTGAGVLTLAGSNVISGITGIDAGTLRLQNANATTNVLSITSATQSALNLASGTTLQLRANAATTFRTGLITLPHGTVNINVDNNGSGSGNTLTLGTAANSIAGLNVAITTASSVSTTLNITGANGYGLALGRILNPTTVAGTAFTVNAGTVPVTMTQFQTGGSGSNFIAGSGTTTLGSGVTFGLMQSGNGNNTVTVNSSATLFMPLAVGANGRTGGTLTAELNSGGTLVVNHAGALTNAFTSGQGASSFLINGGTLDNTTASPITITGNPVQTWSGDFTFTGTRSLNLGTGAVTMVGNRRVTVSAETLTIGGAISGAGLTKAGTGTLTLSGTNTYTGETAVSAGKLVINGSISTSALTTVAAGATLGGVGTVGAATIDGVLAPGNSIGTLTATGDVTWNANPSNAWAFELGLSAADLTLANTTGTRDLLNITGAGNDFLKGTGTGFAFDFSNTGTVGYYKLVDWIGTTTFADTDFTATNLTSGLSGSFIVDSGTSALYLNVIPEPGVALLSGLGALLLLRRRRA